MGEDEMEDVNEVGVVVADLTPDEAPEERAEDEQENDA